MGKFDVGNNVFINSKIIKKEEKDGVTKYFVEVLGQLIEVDESVMYNWKQPE